MFGPVQLQLPIMTLEAYKYGPALARHVSKHIVRIYFVDVGASSFQN